MTVRRYLPVALLVLVAAGAVALLLASGDGGDYHVRIQAYDAAGLRKDFLVKIAGTPVGKVDDVELDHADHAVATLSIDKSAAPVGLDARAAIRASNLLGEKYVDLEPGDVRDPAPSGHLIPRGRTTTSTDLDDVLSVLDSDTRAALASFLVGQGQALGANGTTVSAALRRLPPALDQATELVDGLAHDNRALGRLVARTDRALRAIGPQHAALGRLVDEAGRALTALDGRGTALRDTVREAPGALRQLDASLAALQDAANPLAPAARGLQATAAPLTRVLRTIPSFTRTAAPVLRTARAVSPQLRRLGRNAAPTLRRLRPAVADLRTFAGAADPVTRLLDTGMPDLLGVMQNWARAIQNVDGAGHVFRVNVVADGTPLDLLQRYVEDGSKRPRRSGAPRRRRTGSSAQPPKSPEPTATTGSPRPPAPAPRPTVRLPGVKPIPLPVDPAPVSHGVKTLLDYLLRP
jgi:phospholipid/cholesterol/gamma-HCH transport system substrate-binding protein